MRSRKAGLIIALALVMLSAPVPVYAQQPMKLAHIGVLGATAAAAFPQLIDAFRQGLREHGYVEGQNLAIEFHWAEGKAERFPGLAADLVRLKVDAMAAFWTPGALAAKKATTTIPIVIAFVGDPVGAGLVASLARPGGNITGLGLLTPEVNAKRLQLLKEAVPGLSRVAVLWNTGNRAHESSLQDLEAAARTLGLEIQQVAAERAEDLEGGFAAMKRGHATGLIVLPSPLSHLNLRRIADLAAAGRLPSMMEFNEFADVGGLMAYGPSLQEMFQRAGALMGKILKGAKPADLPVEQPTRFEMVINLTTAKALGLTIPPSVLIRADQVIQ